MIFGIFKNCFSKFCYHRQGVKSRGFQKKWNDAFNLFTRLIPVVCVPQKHSYFSAWTIHNGQDTLEELPEHPNIVKTMALVSKTFHRLVRLSIVPKTMANCQILHKGTPKEPLRPNVQLSSNRKIFKNHFERFRKSQRDRTNWLFKQFEFFKTSIYQKFQWKWLSGKILWANQLRDTFSHIVFE